MIKPLISVGPGSRSTLLVGVRHLISSVGVILMVLGSGLNSSGATAPIITNFANVLNPVIDAVVAQNGLDQRVAGMAKGVIGMLSQSSAGGEEVRVSVSVQNRKLSIGPLQLLEVPALEWPNPHTR